MVLSCYYLIFQEGWLNGGGYWRGAIAVSGKGRMPPQGRAEPLRLNPPLSTFLCYLSHRTSNYCSPSKLLTSPKVVVEIYQRFHSSFNLEPT